MPVAKDITGQRFGRLVVLSLEGKTPDHHTRWRCRCDCGNETVVARNNLGPTKSCGCTRRGKGIKDLTGKRFTRLLVIKMVDDIRPVSWLCKCDCGTEKVLSGKVLKNGHTKSCGCLNIERTGNLNRKHGASVPSSPLYSTFNIWMGMLDRCRRKSRKDYRHYGGRGIKVDPRWNVFETFLEDMGPRPGNLSIERIDTNGNYCKENCRWATQLEQVNNARSNRKITFNGKTQNMSQWAREVGMEYDTLRQRLDLGWDSERALTAPVRGY